MTEVRPQGFTPIAAARGEEWAVNYARKIKDQEPIWVRGTSRGLMAVMTGEQTLYHLPYYHSCIREKRKDVSKSMECKLIEPVPIRIQEMTGILESSPYAHAPRPVDGVPDIARGSGHYRDRRTKVFTLYTRL